MIPWLLHPCPGQVVTQRFGENVDWYPRSNGHTGIDFGGTEFVPIRAAYAGTVESARDGGMEDYGIRVFLRHEDGSLTIYGHLSSLAVQDGQRVKAGDTLGMMGNTGRSTGVHLHFEYRPGTSNIPIDPMGLIVDKIPNEAILCLATCTNGGVRVRTGRSVNRGIVREVAQGRVEAVYDFYPFGWMRLEDGYSLIGDEAGKWWEFNPTCAEPAGEPKEVLFPSGKETFTKRQGRFIAE